MLYWVTEHLGIVITAALVIFTSLTVLTGRSVWRQGRRLERRPGPIAGFGATVVLLLAAGAGLVIASVAAKDIAPVLIQQGRFINQPAPTLRFASVADDSAGTLADHRGKVVLVNLWATWCPPCREEMPDLDRLQKTYRDRGLVVLQISDEDRETIAGYLEEQPMSTEHGYVDSFPWPAFGRPTTFIVDREGVVRKTIQGGRPFELFEEAVSEYL